MRPVKHLLAQLAARSLPSLQRLDLNATRPHSQPQPQTQAQIHMQGPDSSLQLVYGLTGLGDRCMYTAPEAYRGLPCNEQVRTGGRCACSVRGSSSTQARGGLVWCPYCRCPRDGFAVN
jgi:hypothetical protein